MLTRGEMLWFNAAKDLGALRTPSGERMEVSGTAFASDAKPCGRCAGRVVEFECVDQVVRFIAFVPEQPAARRARRRHARS